MNWDDNLADWQQFVPVLASKRRRLKEEVLSGLRERHALLPKAHERGGEIVKGYADLRVTRWLAELKPMGSAADGAN
jgi:hypothetical protein